MCSAVPNLIQFSWNLKIFYGAAQDAFPISGKHRIPSILAGWVLVVGMALVLVFFAGEPARFQISTISNRCICTPHRLLCTPHRLPCATNCQPSITRPRLTGVRASGMSPPTYSQRPPYLRHADGASVVVYSALCAVLELGLAIADTAADALMVSYSTAESLKERGTIMSHCYALRFFAGTCSSLAVAVLYNGDDEGGDSSWSLTLGYAGRLPLINTQPQPSHHRPTCLATGNCGLWRLPPACSLSSPFCQT